MGIVTDPAYHKRNPMSSGGSLKIHTECRGGNPNGIGNMPWRFNPLPPNNSGEGSLGPRRHPEALKNVSKHVILDMSPRQLPLLGVYFFHTKSAYRIL